ncbi:hypothetical protein LP419_12625 [Massilia sp. H-1]|nr:hypothetical protein LP419_12625 [Massilia sp. H-1]
MFEEQYEDAPFVDVMPFGSHPETRSTRGANVLRLALHRPGNGDMLVILVVQDNLVKGASGQAVQCMNLMFGFDEGAKLAADRTAAVSRRAGGCRRDPDQRHDLVMAVN